ncbi:MAG TPA: DUF4837 family protein [Flavobacteriaceae bacterium]|nr:DUF4837 family protein [Flavobacteriaceae bacterium]HEX5742673.1 DUF4837 family protein [Flavobacteriaceae bacterium]
MKKIISLLLTIILFISCSDTKPELTLVNSTGKINHLLVVIKNTQWQGEVGDEIRKILGSPVLGLPQPETQFNITQVAPEYFGSMFKTSRSVLHVTIGEKNQFSIKNDVYSKPQRIIQIVGKDNTSLAHLIQKHQNELISVFKNNDLNSTQKMLNKDLWEKEKIKTFKSLGFQLNIPKKYKMVDDNGAFLWMRNPISSGSMNIIAYSVPILSDNDLTGNNIISIRDSIGKKHIPGGPEGSYMITEAAYSPHIFNITLIGKKAFETRGKWEVYGDFMAGPFLNYTVIDEKNNRLVVVEGFAYAPAVDKRDYMFELEAVLKTLKIN